MHLLSLQLTNFRNYRLLAHEFAPGPVVLVADNAQGKSNLLEAICLLSRASSPWAASDRELLNWEAEHDDIPSMRLVGTFAGSSAPTQVELSFAPDLEALQRRAAGAPLRLKKRLRINGVPRRASELIGRASVVLFDPGEVAILSGEPGRRRAFLDTALGHLNRDYQRATQQLAKLLPQRNALLKAIHEGQAEASQLDFWDDRLVENAVVITEARMGFLDWITPRVQQLHEQFTGSGAPVVLAYRSTITKYASVKPGRGEELASRFRETLALMRRRETLQGVTLVGPQRDDFDVVLDGVDLHSFGSRGQQRTAAICLKLAEVDALAARFGTPPLLLLDELFAELDPHRRRTMQEMVETFEQPFITTTDLDHLEPSLVAGAQILRIRGGALVHD